MFFTKTRLALHAKLELERFKANTKELRNNQLALITSCGLILAVFWLLKNTRSSHHVKYLSAATVVRFADHFSDLLKTRSQQSLEQTRQVGKLIVIYEVLKRTGLTDLIKDIYAAISPHLSDENRLLLNPSTTPQRSLL